MKLAILGTLLTIPAVLIGQDKTDPARLNAADAAINAAQRDPSTVPAPIRRATLVEPLTPKQKVKRRALRLVEPVSLVSAGFGAGIEQWRGIPSEWGQGAEGYAKRFASAEGYMAAHNTIALGFDLAFHLDPRYHRSEESGFMPRLKNAIKQSVIARKDDGGSMIDVSEIAGSFGAGLIANAWEPARYSTVGDGLQRGAIGLAYHTLKNIAREFLPDLFHLGQSTPASSSPPSRHGFD